MKKTFISLSIIAILQSTLAVAVEPTKNDGGFVFSEHGKLQSLLIEELKSPEKNTVFFPGNGSQDLPLQLKEIYSHSGRKVEIHINDISDERLGSFSLEDYVIDMGDIVSYLDRNPHMRKTFDVVYAANLLHQLSPSSIYSAIEMFRKVLKDDGKIIL